MAKKVRSVKKNKKEYKNPPVFEVVYSVITDTIQNITLPHLGLFYNNKIIKNDFNQIKEVAQILPSKAIEVPVTIKPRIWFIGKKDEYILQFQNDRFSFNWKKNTEKDPYVRYNSTKLQFQKYFQAYQTFLSKNKFYLPEIKNVELTKVNHIPLEDCLNEFKKFKKVFNFLNFDEFEKLSLNDKPSNLIFQFEIDSKQPDISLVFVLRKGRRKIDDKDIIYFEIRASTKDTIQLTADNIYTHFDSCNDIINDAFNFLTNEHAKTDYWN